MPMFSVLSKKAYKNAILVWLLSSFIFTVPLLGQDRGTVCSTPDLSYAQTESFTAVLKSRKAKKARGLKDYVNYDLPVHLYIIADEEGNLPQTSSFPYESVEQMTESAGCASTRGGRVCPDYASQTGRCAARGDSNIGKTLPWKPT